MKNRPRYLLILAVVSSLAMGAGDAFKDMPGIYDENENAVDYQFQEQHEKLPALPKSENLIPFEVVNRDYDNYQYSIDSASLSIGEHDGIRRYTVVIASRNGIRNLRYEAIRCETGEYKTYAYAIEDAAFRIFTTPQWQNIGKEGSGRYRYTLLDEYFCSNFETEMNLPEILRTLRYPPESDPGAYDE